MGARTLVFLLFCLGLCANAAAETRVALVIGNGAYANVGLLDNPMKDAKAVAAALRGAGFSTVQVEQDLSRSGLVDALRRFETVSDTADWSLVYYAGHGIEVGGANYLVPVDARLKSDRDVEDEAVSLAQVQKRLEGARKLRLVILDACRDNPFAASMKRSLRSRSAGRGLAPPELNQTGSLVAYSAASGQVASDGEDGQGNSPYAAALVRNLAEPDLEVNLFFRRVRSQVLRATGQKQEPATYESLPEDRFVFTPAKISPVPVVSAPPAPAVPNKQVAALAPVEPPPRAAETRKGYLGVSVQEKNKDSELPGLPKGSRGAMVVGFDPNGPAARADLVKGDVVVSADGQPVETVQDLPRIVQSKPVGDSIGIELVRDGKRRTTYVTIGSRNEVAPWTPPEAPSPAPSPPPVQNPAPVADAPVGPVLGLTLARLTEEMRSRFRVDDHLNGVVVTQVEPKSAADKKRIKPGHVIVGVASGSVEGPADVVKAYESDVAKGGSTTLLLVSSKSQSDARYVALNHQ